MRNNNQFLEPSRIPEVYKELDLCIFKEIVDKNPIGVVITDALAYDNPIIYCNPAFSRITGYSPNEVLGRNCRFLQGEKTDPDSVSRIRKAIKQGEPIQIELLNYRKDGQPFVNQLHIFPIYNAEGSLTHFVGMQLDITDKIENLKRAECIKQEWVVTVDAINDLIFLTDADERILRCNIAASKFFDVDFLNLIGSKLSELFSSAVCMEVTKEELFKTSRAEFSLPDKHAQYEIVNYPVIRQESPGRWVHVIREITQQRRLEAIAEAKNIAENIGYIFQAFRHEVGNPVNSVKLALNVLRKNLDQFSSEQIIEYIDRSLSEIERIEHLLRLLKNFSLYEDIHLQPTNPCELIKEFIAFMEKDITNRGVGIFFICENGCQDVKVMLNSQAFYQVFLNLITNSLDAFEDSEVMPIIKIHVRCNLSKFEIVISDNGCGMDEQQMENLFKPFYTSKPNGTGLGLVISKKIITKMNGTISIFSEKNRGTNVVISFEIVP